tara:strand:+ start:1061 stop:1471 length:411 start_codon:yes stop_codon:yes gene_type:complete
MLELKTDEQKTLPVKIDNTEYQMRTYSALAFKDYVRLQNFSESYKDLVEGKFANLSDKKIEGLSDSLGAMVTLVMEGVPESVLQALSLTNQLAIIQHFTSTVPKEDESIEKLTKSSQDSQDSTEERQKIGSTPVQK